MSISIASSKTASIATTLAAELSPTDPALAEKLVSSRGLPRKDDVKLIVEKLDDNIKNGSNNNNNKRNDSSRERTIPAPSYESSLGNIPALDPLPPPPVYDIVNCSTSQTLLLVSSLINTILTVNDRLQCPKITLFHSRAIPNISIEAYLTRILQYAPFQNEVLLIILLYFDRIGGGCKPTQVLTNNIPKPLLLKAFGTDQNPFATQNHSSYDTTLMTSSVPSLIPEKAPVATTPKLIPKGDARLMDELMKDGGAETDKESAKAAVLRQAKELEAKHQYYRRAKPLMPGSKPGMDSEMPEEEEPIEDEIYTSSAESPIGSKLIINSFNIHRLLITSILVASKFSSDVFYPNVRYSRVGGLPLSELNQLELEFLFLSQFELNANEAELQAYGNKLLMYQQRLAGEKKLPSLSPSLMKQPSPPPPHTPYAAAVDLKEKVAVESSTVSHPPMTEPTPPVVQPSMKPPALHAPAPTRPAPLHGSYRDSKEGIRQDYVDDEDTISQRGDDSIMSPTESEVDMSVLKDPRPTAEDSTAASRPYSRHRVMNLDSLVWPTNEVEDYRPSTNYFFGGGMVKDEDAERIEQEFNRPSPPPEAQEQQKRKLQRLSSGSMETTPSKRVNPSHDKKASKESRLSASSSASSSSSSGNILRPFLRKIASLAHRSGPQSEEPVEPEPLPLRTHPYLVRPRVSPPSPALPEPAGSDGSNAGADAAVTWHTATPPTAPAGPGSSSSSWVRQRSDPPPYSGRIPHQAATHSSESLGSRSSSHSRNRATRDYRRHRSREPSISTLASELTFEPRRPSLSVVEDESEARHAATLAPLTFPSRPQPIHNMRHPGGHAQSMEDMEDDEEMPMAEREDGTLTHHEQSNVNSMQVDHAPEPNPRPRPSMDTMDARQFAPVAAMVATTSTTKKVHPLAPATPGKSRSSSRRSSVSSNATDLREQDRSSLAGRQWNPCHAPGSSLTTSDSSPTPGVAAVGGGGGATGAATTTTTTTTTVGGHPPRAPQVYHPHHSPYVASYYAPPPPPNNLQLYHDPVTMKTYPIMSHNHHHHPHQSVLVAMPPLTVPMSPTVVAPAHPTLSAATNSQPRQSKTPRQFASIRPRTPTVIAAQAAAAAEAAASASATTTTTEAQPALTSNSDAAKSGHTAKSSKKKKSLFGGGGSKKSAAAALPPPPPPNRPPPPLPFMTAGAAPAFGHPPIMAFAHAPPPPHGASGGRGATTPAGVVGRLGTAVASAGAPILIPLIPVMYNNVRPLPLPPPPPPLSSSMHHAKPAPPTLVKIAPRLPRA
ncbi:hypothetical protein DFQ27_001059 [Actinomortierella ambigua]|uniref:Cyclin-domain-containing protein n=1 Tax=Actinomortierella ambigua TaxID=1343610 RepID=A0A9P6QB75_9FUNG|nr:hypothetical protein DFQ27_001059 [Actinomortierella ambigua]